MSLESTSPPLLPGYPFFPNPLQQPQYYIKVFKADRGQSISVLTMSETPTVVLAKSEASLQLQVADRDSPRENLSVGSILDLDVEDSLVESLKRFLLRITSVELPPPLDCHRVRFVLQINPSRQGFLYQFRRNSTIQFHVFPGRSADGVIDP